MLETATSVQGHSSSHSDSPELQPITDNGTLASRSDHPAGPECRHKPASLLFWLAAANVRDWIPILP